MGIPNVGSADPTYRLQTVYESRKRRPVGIFHFRHAPLRVAAKHYRTVTPLPFHPYSQFSLIPVVTTIDGGVFDRYAPYAMEDNFLPWQV